MQVDLPMWKSRLYTFLKEFDNIKTTSDAEYTNGRLSWLCDVKEIVQQSLIVMSAKKVKLLDDKDKILGAVT